MSTTAIAVFTRDLRVHDNPVLAAAARADHVLPLFVHDEAVSAAGFAAGPRRRFLDDCLADLDARLRERGAALVRRDGDVAAEVARLAHEVDATSVHIAADASAFAARRQRRLAEALASQRCELTVHEAVHTVLPAGEVTPQGNDHFAVFTPYHRRWASAARRSIATAPRHLRLPPTVSAPDAPAPARTAAPMPGGETEARDRAHRWLDEDADHYHSRHDDLPAERGTSRLSAYLHFGCLSALELATEAGARHTEGADAFVRQLAWRDFHFQVLAARPASAQADYRPRADAWRDDPQALQAWQEGQTGIPIVDAGMRQLSSEGWMHNRARLITGSFLAKTLYLDWRAGAEHFQRHLVDGDIANNQMNWQWVAGTGTDTRPNRVLNPVRQAERYDSSGDYVRRWVPELADLDNPRDLHQPWRLGTDALGKLGYPAPIVDLEAARDRFQQHRR
ncbi:cryptochrome/photolyase family protein [Saccharopolyspora dendranthemae]|uniref:Deoxyribodipyrimidine photo-lyase n=1 Tax=Saccharopolyspora dendranthemae TaxID=1181886 RepID=A0A561U8A1_9PSEU|nr:deoxyribodipyrimidine photo-lyase [Saccharopolyspora dendranthemae]TWF95598.1 deoxyribodipyrimidine photo-lyase [Saccharopolyspora dendranthemae]